MNLEHVRHHSRGIRLTDLTGAYKTPITRSLKACTAYPAGPVHEHSQRTDTQKALKANSHTRRGPSRYRHPPRHGQRDAANTHTASRTGSTHAQLTDKRGRGPSCSDATHADCARWREPHSSALQVGRVSGKPQAHSRAHAQNVPRDAHTPRCTGGDNSHSAAPPRHAACRGTARAGIRTCLYMSMRPARARTCALRERSTTRPTPAPHIPAQPSPELQSQFASVVLRHPRPLHAAAYRACPYMSGGYPNQPKPLPKSRRSPSSSSRPKPATLPPTPLGAYLEAAQTAWGRKG